MLNSLYKLAFSWYCTLILSSALLGAAPKSFQTAAMGSADAMLAAMKGNGWSVNGVTAKTSIPDASPARVSAAQGSASVASDIAWLAETAKDVDQNGETVDFNGNLLTALGLTQNGTRANIKQREYVVTTGKHLFNTTRVRGQMDSFLFNRTANEGWLFLISLDGNLQKAVHAVKGVGPAVVPNKEARAEFDKEFTWWSEHYMDMPTPPGNS